MAYNREYLEKVQPGALERELASFDTKKHQEKKQYLLL